MVSQHVEAQQFAVFLTMFKNRTDRSYEALAKRTGVSSSALHRYCAGVSVPTDYGLVRHFAMECGATQTELRELHRRWILADAGRRGQFTVAAPSVEGSRRRTPQRMTLLAVVALAVTVGVAVWGVSARAVPATPRRR
jgi:hypothetical protein